FRASWGDARVTHRAAPSPRRRPSGRVARWGGPAVRAPTGRVAGPGGRVLTTGPQPHAATPRPTGPGRPEGNSWERCSVGPRLVRAVANRVGRDYRVSRRQRPPTLEMPLMRRFASPTFALAVTTALALAGSAPPSAAAQGLVEVKARYTKYEFKIP